MSNLKFAVFFILVLFIIFGCGDDSVQPIDPDPQDTTSIPDTNDTTSYTPLPVEKWVGKEGKIVFNMLKPDDMSKIIAVMDIGEDKYSIIVSDENPVISGGYSGQYNDLRWSPDGSKIAFVVAYSTSGAQYLVLMNEDGTNRKILFANNSYQAVIKNVQWHNDGNKIFFSTGTNRLAYVDLEGNYTNIDLPALYIENGKKIGGLGNNFGVINDGKHILLTGYWQTYKYLFKYNEISNEIIDGFKLPIETTEIKISPNGEQYSYSKYNGNGTSDLIIQSIISNDKIVKENLSYFQHESNWSSNSQYLGITVGENNESYFSNLFYYIFEPEVNKLTKVTDKQVILSSHIYIR